MLKTIWKGVHKLDFKTLIRAVLELCSIKLPVQNISLLLFGFLPPVCYHAIRNIYMYIYIYLIYFVLKMRWLKHRQHTGIRRGHFLEFFCMVLEYYKYINIAKIQNRTFCPNWYFCRLWKYINGNKILLIEKFYTYNHWNQFKDNGMCQCNNTTPSKK